MTKANLLSGICRFALGVSLFTATGCATNPINCSNALKLRSIAQATIEGANQAITAIDNACPVTIVASEG